MRQIEIIAVAVIGFVVVCTVTAWVISRAAPPPLDRFALGTAGLIGITFMVPVDFYAHYAAFFAPFLAVALALSSARLVDVWTGSAARRPALSRVVTPVIAGCVAVWCVVMTVHGISREKKLVASSPAATLDAHVPAGACVVTDDSSLTVVGSRFVSTVPGCTQMIDATATDMSLGNGRMALTGAGRYPAVESAWLDAFRHAQYVVLSCDPPGARRCFTSKQPPHPLDEGDPGLFRQPFSAGRTPCRRALRSLRLESVNARLRMLDGRNSGAASGSRFIIAAMLLDQHIVVRLRPASAVGPGA